MDVFDFAVQMADGGSQPLATYRGKVLLVVNTASKCGFTPQLQGLQELYDSYRDLGLEVLGFPCNQFGGQAPGTDEEQVEFCRTAYKVTFPVFAKVNVNGSDAHPLYEHLKATAKGALGTESIKWNFTKFLIDRDGNVVHRFAPNTAPAELRGEIDRLLQSS